MTKPRTLEEIASVCYERLVADPEMEDQSLLNVILYALREAADAARCEEQEALTAEIDRLSDQPLTDEQRMDALCRWNLARSRAEEPK